MRRWIEWCGLGLMLWGCSAGEAGFVDDPTDGVLPDMRDMGQADAAVCGEGEIFNGRGCVPLAVDSCDAVDERLGEGCIDEDGDCFPAKCDGPVPPGLRDCHDMRADQHPGRIESCDGRDNDCDGSADEDFALGRNCSACGRDGRLECALDGTVACSVRAGQSDELLLDELCDRIDQDCDGVIDEGCLRPLPPGVKTAPRWCGESLIYLSDGLPTRLDLITGMTQQLHDQPAVEPTCHGDLVVWLQAAGCEGGDTTPLRCAGAQLMLHESDRTRPLAPRGDLGAPIIGPDGVYLHELSMDGSTLLRAPFSGQPAEVLDAFSDPTEPVDDALVARRQLGERLKIELVSVNSSTRMALSNPENAEPGRPARDGDLIAWTAGQPPVLWVLVEPTAQGAQVGAALPIKPWVVDGQVWWLAPDGLHRFNAASGIVDRVTDAPPSPSQLWVGPPGRVQLVDDGARFWAASPPEPLPRPDADMGMMDAGPLDADVLDMQGGDAGPTDMGTPDAGDATSADMARDANPPDAAP